MIELMPTQFYVFRSMDTVIAKSFTFNDEVRYEGEVIVHEVPMLWFDERVEADAFGFVCYSQDDYHKLRLMKKPKKLFLKRIKHFLGLW